MSNEEVREATEPQPTGPESPVSESAEPVPKAPDSTGPESHGPESAELVPKALDSTGPESTQPEATQPESTLDDASRARFLSDLLARGEVVPQGEDLPAGATHELEEEDGRQILHRRRFSTF